MQGFVLDIPDDLISGAAHMWWGQVPVKIIAANGPGQHKADQAGRSGYMEEQGCLLHHQYRTGSNEQAGEDKKIETFFKNAGHLLSDYDKLGGGGITFVSCLVPGDEL